MTDYSALVTAAIAQAHAKAEEMAANSINRFEVGRTYSTSSVCDHNCIYSYEVISRTEKTITIMDIFSKSISRRKVHIFRGAESVYPEGSFSMCPVLTA